jgi:hypothetical protein
LWRAYISDRTSIVRRSLQIFWQTFGHRRCPGLMYCNRYYGRRSVRCLFAHLGGGHDLAYPKSCTRWYTLLERRSSLHGCQTPWLTRWETLKTLVAVAGFKSEPRPASSRYRATSSRASRARRLGRFQFSDGHDPRALASAHYIALSPGLDRVICQNTELLRRHVIGNDIPLAH